VPASQTTGSDVSMWIHQEPPPVNNKRYSKCKNFKSKS